jgi:uncharacterized protein (TIGR02466 family)
MQAVDPWSPIIFKDNFTDVDFDSVISKIDPILNATKFNAVVEQDGGLSSIAHFRTENKFPHQWREFEKFREWANERANYAISKWQLSQAIPYTPIESWINRHAAGAWTSEHNHRGTTWACAYYLRVPENSGRFMVRDPMEYHWGTIKSVENRGGVDDIWYPIEVKTGDFLLFPPWLYHKTEKNLSNESRYVLSVNYDVMLMDNL